MQSPSAPHVSPTYLPQVVVQAAAGHELENDAQVGLPGAGPYELYYVLVPHLPHDRYFLQEYGEGQSCALFIRACAGDLSQNSQL